MYRFARVTIPILATGLLATSSAAQETSTLALELWGGASFGADRLGNTHPIEPAGYLSLGEPEVAPLFGAGVRLAPMWLGLRPHARVAYGLPASVAANWTPCDPGLACPAILTTPETRTSRLEGTVGLDFPILDTDGPVRPSASIGVGFRHHRISWDRWDDAAPSFVLPAGSHGETDFLVKVGLEMGIPAGRWEIVSRVSADFSRFGPGRFSPGREVLPLFGPDGIDLGRGADNLYTVTVGVRRPIG